MVSPCPSYPTFSVPHWCCHCHLAVWWPASSSAVSRAALSRAPVGVFLGFGKLFLKSIFCSMPAALGTDSSAHSDLQCRYLIVIPCSLAVAEMDNAAPKLLRTCWVSSAWQTWEVQFNQYKPGKEKGGDLSCTSKDVLSTLLLLSE